jgi:HAD superfamily hydrolase (TIGR01509 family)
MTIKALFFDFDGVVIETEVPAFQSWQEIYGEFGLSLSVDDWAACLGTVGGFDPIAHLQQLTGCPVDDAAGLIERRWQRKMELLAKEDLRPGIAAYLQRAAQLELQVAIVSSDTDEWIDMNLTRVGRKEGWHHIICANGDVTRAKPHPCLYEEALTAVELEPSQAIVFEDSPNGIQAAKAAGLFCVAIPNPVTKWLDLSAADMNLLSLKDMPLDDVIRKVENRPSGI